MAYQSPKKYRGHFSNTGFLFPAIMAFLSWSYVEGVSAWGEMTSATRFCEINNYFTTYIAGFVNTLTNLAYVYLGVCGMSNSKQHPITNSTSIRLCYMSLLVVGACSTIFHSNVKYFAQILDQGSILLPTSTILYASFSFTLAPLPRLLLASGLSLGSAILVSYHAIYHSQKIFGNVFLALVFIIVARCMVLLSRVTDDKVKREMRSLVLFGGVLFVVGSVAFNVDRNYCAQLRAMREVVGIPLGFMLEMHGWWHIGSGLGVYYFIVLIEYLRIYIGTSGAEITLKWKSALLLPRLEVQDTKTK
ncbi:ceramidase [Truncatella angustata]|uniref:Ceramidase n=1 Tax=Truncatella angustata TaxID=152316 RepID=A0A9P8UFP2_9PEZI|nr:ceramidase [Truncatella angustata]KAH6649062.1 ceramidase [Truncatella angustata]